MGKPGASCICHTPRMGVLEEYWGRLEHGLVAQFEAERAAHRDSSVKGTANEDILSRFLSQQTGARRIAARSAIIDHLGGRSDEVDVVVLNDSQPFWTGESGQLLIAEGVDAVYQVKARLTSSELRRAIKNAKSVKNLLRPLPAGSSAMATDSDGPRFIDRIPFFIFAFESSISVDTALKVLGSELPDDDYDVQPDGIFILGAWEIINIADNLGALKIGPPDNRGFQRLGEDFSIGPLASMLWCHHLFVHRRLDFMSPLVQYHPFRRIN